MINLCRMCHKMIDDGDKVVIKVASTYHLANKTDQFGLSQDEMGYINGSICHWLCEVWDDEFED